MNAELITIGDEILIGQIVDTNSAWMAAELNQIGIKIAQITSVSDKPNHLIAALNEARQRAGIVIMTGGLGPTRDDRTKKVLSEYFNSKLVLHKETLEHVIKFFERRGLGLTRLNHDQALIPECCTVLFNPAGTAPGMWIEDHGVIFVALPGVPFEMKDLMTNQVLPRLIKLNNQGAIVHKTILTTGISESLLAETIDEWESALPENIHLAYLPDPGRIRLRLSAYGHNGQQLHELIAAEIEKLKQIIPNAIYGYNEETLAGAVGKLLIEKGATMASAESCTGGYIAHLITSVPGSSAWFKGAIVAYANETKVNVLGVDQQLIAEFGAVSEQVVGAMARGAIQTLNVDYAVATSGIAGPDGGTEEKPVGTVWIAVAGKDKIMVKKFNFANNRERNIIRSSQTALDILRLMLLDA